MIFAAGAVNQGWAFVAEQAAGSLLVQGLQLANPGQPKGGEAAFRGGADAWQNFDGLRGQHCGRFGAKDGEAAGFVTASSELG